MLKNNASIPHEIAQNDVSIAQLPLISLIIDANDGISALNAAAEEFFQTAAKSALGKKLAQLLRDDVVFTAIDRVRAGDSYIKHYGHALTHHGREDVVNLHVFALPSGIGIFIDPLKQAQEGHAEALRASGMMAAMLAHEVKNPLSGIRGAAQILKDEAPEESRHLADLICSEVDRIAGVLAPFETFSEERPPALAALNIHEVLHYVQSVAATGIARGVTFYEEYDPSLPEVLGNRDVLIQILLNLVKNACEAKATSIRLITRYDHDATPPIAVIMEDNGPGIAPEMQANLFQPFASDKGIGRGLGLAISAKLAKDMGGSLTLKNSKPGCTKFRLLLSKSH